MMRTAACAVIVLFLAATTSVRTSAASPSDRQQPTFSASVEMVRVDVLVTRDGQPLRGLTADDFEVLDNGVPQQVNLVSAGQLPLDLVLAFDVSESVSGARLGQLRSASDVLLDELTRGDQVSLVTFNHMARVKSKFTADFGAIRAALERAQAQGGTALFDGTYLSLLASGRLAGRGLLIIFSDGLDTCSWLSPGAVVEAARRSGQVVYAVAVGATGAAPPAFLHDISRATGGRVVEVDTTWNLSSMFVDILDEFRQRYVVSYLPRGVPKDGWHRLEVRVRDRKAIVKAREGYFGG